MLKTIEGVSPGLDVFVEALNLPLNASQRQHVIQIADGLVTRHGSKTLGVVRLFLDKGYRRRLLERETNEAVLEFWYEEYESFSPAQREQIREPVVYRMLTFYGNPDLYPAICHPDALDFGGLMREGKIILVSLGVDEARVPERAGLAGAGQEGPRRADDGDTGSPCVVRATEKVCSPSPIVH